MKFIIFTLFLFFGCSSQKAAKTSSSTVELDPAHKNKNDIEIDTSEVPEEVLAPEIIKKKYKLFFVTGAYDAFTISDFLKRWDEKKLVEQTESVSSLGFGSLVMALYADGGTTNLLDWKLFKLKNKLQNIDEVYSEKWIKALESFIDEEFAGKKIEDLKVKMVFYQYDDKINNLKTIQAGKLAPLLKKEINLTRNDENKSLMWSRSIALERLNNNFDQTLITVNTAPRKLEMKNPDGYTWGLLTRKYSMGRDYNYKIDMQPEIEFVDSLKKNFVVDGPSISNKIDELLVAISNHTGSEN